MLEAEGEKQSFEDFGQSLMLRIGLLYGRSLCRLSG